MTYLSLFSGGMGGDLAMQHLIGMRCLGYVEIEEYCQKLIRQRQEDGVADRAPIFTDIRAFNMEYAREYTGMVDVVTGGPPCQPFSREGKRMGTEDERNMWPEMAKAIKIIRPHHVLFENVPGIQSYLPVVIRDMRRMGYTVSRPQIMSSGSTGALHIRKRVWIHSYSNSDGRVWQRNDIFAPARIRMQTWTEFEGLVQDILRSCVPASKGGGKHDAISRRMDRLRATGNGQDPVVAALAWEVLNG